MNNKKRNILVFLFAVSICIIVITIICYNKTTMNKMNKLEILNPLEYSIIEYRVSDNFNIEDKVLIAKFIDLFNSNEIYKITNIEVTNSGPDTAMYFVKKGKIEKIFLYGEYIRYITEEFDEQYKVMDYNKFYKELEELKAFVK